jgi:hypothetical protein
MSGRAGKAPPAPSRAPLAVMPGRHFDYQEKIMKIAIITFLFLTLTTEMFANKIDAIKTDEDLEIFLHRQNKDLKGFYVASISTLYYDTTQQNIADSLGVKPWQKVDFDNNGLTDLLVYGMWHGRKHLLAVIDEGNKFTLRSLNRGFFDNILFPVVTKIDKQTFLILSQGCEFCRETNKKIIKTDTLVYKYGDFIEPNFSFVSYKIEKIELSTTICFGICPVFELEINADRTANYNAIQYNDKKGKFKTTIIVENFNSLMTLLNYTDFPKLKDTYSVNWTDDQTCTLKVTYDNGMTKTIIDYGEIGTNGLRMVYNQLFSLRKNQSWKKT